MTESTSGNGPEAEKKPPSVPNPSGPSGPSGRPGKSKDISPREFEELYSPSRPREEQGFSPVTIAIYIVVGLLLVAGIGGSIIGLKSGPLGKPHKLVSQRSISARTTFRVIQGNGWRLNMSMLLSPSVAYMKYTLEGPAPIKLQMLGARYKIGNGDIVPLKLPPAYLMFEPLSPKEETSRAFWLGGSPVYSITILMRIDDGHEIRNETVTFD
jgi:hypothetical protein